MPKEPTPEIVAGYDIAPLRKLLKKRDQIAQAIDDAEKQEPDLRKEIDDYMDRINPKDQEALKLIRVKRDMLEMIPIYLNKWQRELGAIEENIKEMLAPLDDVIRKIGLPEYDAVIAEASKIIRPYMASDANALQVASDVDCLGEIRFIIQAWRDSSTDPSVSAKRGLEIIARYQATGFIREKTAAEVKANSATSAVS